MALLYSVHTQLYTRARVCTFILVFVRSRSRFYARACVSTRFRTRVSAPSLVFITCIWDYTSVLTLERDTSTLLIFVPTRPERLVFYVSTRICKNCLSIRRSVGWLVSSWLNSTSIGRFVHPTIGNLLVKINEGTSLVYVAYPVSLLSAGIGNETCKLSSLPLKREKKGAFLVVRLHTEFSLMRMPRNLVSLVESLIDFHWIAQIFIDFRWFFIDSLTVIDFGDF